MGKYSGWKALISVVMAFLISGCGGGSASIDLGRIALSDDGTRVFVADQGLRGLRILDISDAAQPELLGKAGSEEIGSSRTADIVVSADGSRAYVSVYDDYAPLFNVGGNLVAFDVSDVSSPRQIGSYRTSDRQDAFTAPLALSPDSERLFGTHRGGMLSVFDVRGSGDPVLLKEHDVSAYGACSVHPDGHRVYCGDQILDPDAVTDVPVENPSLYGAAQAFSGSGDRMVLADYSHLIVERGYIDIFDTSDPDDPTVLDRYSEDDATYVDVAFAPDGSKVYLLNENKGVQILTVDATGTPTKVAQYDWEGARGLALSGDGGTLYVTAGTKGMRILDIHDPANIRLLGEYK